MTEGKKKFSKYGLKTFIFVIFLLVSIVPLLISNIINYNRNKKATMDAAISSRDQFMSLASLETNNIVEQVEKIYMRLAVDKDLLQKMKERPADNLEELQRIQYVNQNILEPYLALYPYIENFIIYPQEANYAIVCGVAGFAITDNYKDFKLYRTALQNPQKSFWQGLHEYEGSYHGYTIKNIISFYQAVDLKDQDFVIEIQIKKAAFEEKIQAGKDSFGSRVTLADEEGRTVSSNQMAEDSQEYYINKTIILNNNWTLSYGIPEAVIKENAQLQLYTMLGITAVYILLAAILAVLTSVLVSWPIKKVITQMQIPLDEDTADYKFDSKIKEIAYLAESYENMRARTKGLIENLIKEQYKKQMAEMRVLQAQIDPHFLYNSLNLIRCTAVLEGQKDIEKMTSAIIQLLEFSINSQECVTINDEVHITKQYIALQECRHNKKMDVNIQVQEGAGRYVMLKMSVIPLVENAIIHAYNQGEGDVRIDVCIYRKGEKLLIEVQDYGSGMTQKRISELMEESQSSKKFNRIGVKNIIERIQLYFGDTYNLTINSGEGKGTLVRLEHPVLCEKDWEEIRIKYHEKNCNS